MIAGLLEMWLKEHEQKCRRLAVQAQGGYDVLKDKTTLYARSIQRLAQAHGAAADVYRAALEADDEAA